MMMMKRNVAKALRRSMSLSASKPLQDVQRSESYGPTVNDEEEPRFLVRCGYVSS
jgi:hypothetical protein